jgi:two-component system sensor histidine kinase FlrB
MASPSDTHQPPSEPDPDQLRQAFALFSATSDKLAETYAELQGQVARLSSELAAANGELARRERLSALGEMAAKLAHQLRTPLAAALLYVGQLAGKSLDEAERQRFADKALGRLRHLERLIADMLAFVKGAQGVTSRFPIADLLAEWQHTLDAHALPRGVVLDMEDETAGASLEADRQAVLGALINLGENALQASPAGSIVRLHAQVSGGPFVAIRVEDQGSGIDASARERLFDPFFTTRAEGSGLGLAIVKQTADTCGGWVEVDSEPGRGSVFTLYLPLAET